MYRCLWTCLCMYSMFMTLLQWFVSGGISSTSLICWRARNRQCSLIPSGIFVPNYRHTVNMFKQIILDWIGNLFFSILLLMLFIDWKKCTDTQIFYRMKLAIQGIHNTQSHSRVKSCGSRSLDYHFRNDRTLHRPSPHNTCHALTRPALSVFLNITCLHSSSNIRQDPSWNSFIITFTHSIKQITQRAHFDSLSQLFNYLPTDDKFL